MSPYRKSSTRERQKKRPRVLTGSGEEGVSMARIPKAEIERLKREVSLERLAEARGVRLERHGADLLGRCPFHDDHEPSLVITPSKNLWHCLGACQAGGSVIDWVMKAEGVSFRHAAELLRADLPPEGLSKGPPPERSTVPKLPGLLDATEDDQVLLRRVVDYYHATLKESPEALAYLASRGLQHAEAVERFKLGFANRTLAYRLPAKNRKEGAAIRGRLQALGVIRASGHEHLNGSLVMPVFDEEGRVAELYGRKITPGLRPGTPLHLYLPGPHRGVWNIEALAASREIILCESLLDALSFWCAGFRNVTAAYGTEGMTADHWKAFEKHGTERVLIAYDRDEARGEGRGETRQAAHGARHRGLPHPLPEGDGCERVRAQGAAGGEEPRARDPQRDLAREGEGLGAEHAGDAGAEPNGQGGDTGDRRRCTAGGLGTDRRGAGSSFSG
jgi:DNA primase